MCSFASAFDYLNPMHPIVDLSSLTTTADIGGKNRVVECLFYACYDSNFDVARRWQNDKCQLCDLYEEIKRHHA